jgi:hypothetical protein
MNESLKLKTNNVLILILLSITCINSVSIKSATGLLMETIDERQNSLSHYTNTMRQKHLNNISLIQNYLTNLTEMKKNKKEDEIKNQLSKYFNQLETNINELTTSFQSNYEFCVNDLKKVKDQCKDSLTKLRTTIKYNKEYAHSLTKLNSQYDALIGRFYDMNIFSFSANVCGGNKDITDRNDITQLYTSISKHLDKHFNIFKSEEMEKILAQIETKTDDNMNKFLSQIVKKYSTGTDQKDYVRIRKNMAQLLFNKISTYMDNSINRKSNLIKQGEELYIAMKENDEFVKKEIVQLKNQRRDNAELSYSLNKENEIIIGELKNCENAQGLNSKCEETEKLFKSILHSYKNQSKSIQTLYLFMTKKQ